MTWAAASFCVSMRDSMNGLARTRAALPGLLPLARMSACASACSRLRRPALFSSADAAAASLRRRWLSASRRSRALKEKPVPRI